MVVEYSFPSAMQGGCIGLGCSRMREKMKTVEQIYNNLHEKKVREIVDDVMKQNAGHQILLKIIQQEHIAKYSHKIIEELAPKIIKQYLDISVPSMVKIETQKVVEQKFNKWFQNFISSSDIEKIKNEQINKMKSEIALQTDYTIKSILEHDHRINPIYFSLENITKEKCDKKLEELTSILESRLDEIKELRRQNEVMAENIKSVRSRTYDALAFGIVNFAIIFGSFMRNK
jgi:hypothetical protein